VNRPDPIVLDKSPLLRRLSMLAIAVTSATIATAAAAQNYPWCSNFADGAGTNCGFSSEQQCKVTVQGSGGYCDHNNLYKPPVAAAPARHEALKHRSGKHS
jgi:hypothetical protein